MQCASTHERFGLRFAKEDEGMGVTNSSTTSTCSSTSSPDTFSKLSLNSCTYAQLYERILHTPLPHSGHTKQKNDYTDEIAQSDKSQTGSIAEDDEETECQTVPVTVLKKILMQAVSWFFIHKSLISVSETAHVRLDQIPFMQSTSSDLFNSIMFMPNEEQSADEERLDLLLKSWNQCRRKVSRDGNCLFNSVAYNLQMQVERGNSLLERILTDVGIDSLTQIASALRSGVVEEWLGNHSKAYQLFMTEGQLHAQAEEFWGDGVYASDIGDLAIAAVSNMLRTPIVVFTSRLNQPLHIQHPTYSPMINHHPIYLAYLQAGPGHYDAVHPDTTEQDTNTAVQASIPVLSTHCACGRKSNKGNACSFSLMQYTCRCPCYNSKQPCSQYCRCKGCTNTFGIKPAVEPLVTGKKRKRPAHESQSIPLRGKRTITFMKAVGEPMSIGGFTKLEYLIICSIVQSLMADDWDWEQAQDVNVSEVSAIYSYILELIQTLQLDLTLFERTREQIEKLIRSTSFKWDVFHQHGMAVKIGKKL